MKPCLSVAAPASFQLLFAITQSFHLDGLLLGKEKSCHEAWLEHHEVVINFAFHFLLFQVFDTPQMVMWK